MQRGLKPHKHEGAFAALKGHVFSADSAIKAFNRRDRGGCAEYAEKNQNDLVRRREHKAPSFTAASHRSLEREQDS